MSYLHGRIIEQVVVPVRCDSMQGTAFFINERQLLTARHVVGMHIDSAAQPAIKIDVAGKELLCKAEDVSTDIYRIDLALLTIVSEDDYRCMEPLPLLSDEYVQGQELCVYGYPQEVAMGSNLVSLSVQNGLEIIDGEWGNRALKRMDGLSICNYDGLSGSPVVNESGRVVGVIVVQFNETLNYLSISKAKELLESKGIHPATDWEMDDMTITGEGQSRQFCDKAIKSIHDRYARDLHQDDIDLMKKLACFSNKQQSEKIIEKVTRFAECVKDLPDDQKKPFADKFPQKELTQDVIREHIDLFISCFDYYSSENFRSKQDEDGKIDALKESICGLTIEDFDIFRYASAKALLIVGKAGYGKTHSLCRYAETMQNIANIYLLFGTNFINNLSPIAYIQETICQGLEFENFNVDMRRKERYAVIVIDAINEGLGCKYWNFYLEALRVELEKHDCFRLIVSVRTPFDRNISGFYTGNHWLRREITGFNNIEKAMDTYFEANNIKPNDKYLKIEAFKHPLFLKIFCEAYHSLSINEKENVNKRTLYKRYVQKKNREVSERVDEDLELNIANEYLSALAHYSVYYENFNSISRKIARQYAKRLAPYRLWKNDLLNACLSANLLIDDMSDNEEPIVMFEYENLGDYYKAEELVQSKMEAKEVLRWLEDKMNYLKRHPEIPSEKFVNAVLAYIDCCFQQGDDLSGAKQVHSGGALYEIYCDYLQESDMPKERRVSILRKISSIKQNPFALVQKVKEDTIEDAKSTHKALMLYPTVGSRDLIWTRYVNQLYETIGDGCLNEFFNDRDLISASDEQLQKYLIYLTWMLTSSHPKFRAIVIRKVCAILLQQDTLIIWLIRTFVAVNDPYVLSGLYCAICGIVLPSRDKDLTASITKQIYESYFERTETVPQDLIVRQWMLKIIERAYYLNEKCDYWTRIKTPFSAQPENAEDIPDIDKINKDYFGKEQGSVAIYNSMFTFEDFNRYIIGTNNRNVSDDYFEKKEDGKYYGVPLDDIKTKMSYYIKKVFDWSDELGRLDNGRYSWNRSHNDQERIGKKFQWLAWYKVNAYLMDAYRTTKAQYHYRETATENELAEHPYPWNSAEVSRFDPTLTANLRSEYPMLLRGIDAQPIVGTDDENWIDNNNYLPTFRYVARDVNGTEYVMLMCYDSTRGDVRETFLFSNACFVKNDDAKRYANWAKDQNFYGRWMPERQGNTEFLWGDYPWADSYRSSLEQGNVYRERNCPCDFHLSYEAQLQEDWEGIDHEDEYLSTVYMPSVEIMEKMELYCSEIRGVIKAQDGSIAAINTGKENSIQGLFIRRDILNEFLRRTGYVMFYYVLGEKVYRYEEMRSRMQDLSAAYQYNQEGDINVIQQMRVIEKDLPKKRTEADKKKRIAELEKKRHEGWTQREAIEYVDLKQEVSDEKKPEE